jgi:hypothetical protein
VGFAILNLFSHVACKLFEPSGSVGAPDRQRATISILELREARASKFEEDVILSDFGREVRRHFGQEDIMMEQGPWI